MRAHAAERTAQWEREIAFDRPQAVEERRRVKRAKRAVLHARRQSETRRKNFERLEMLAALARLSPVERLSRFATDPTLTLDCVTVDLISVQERDVLELESAKAVALLARIGRRKGAWGQMRRMLEHLFRDEPESGASQAAPESRGPNEDEVP